MYLYHNANKARCWEQGIEKKKKKKMVDEVIVSIGGKYPFN